MAKAEHARGNLRDLVLANVDAVVRRAKVMSCKMEREKVMLFSFSVRKESANLIIFYFLASKCDNSCQSINFRIIVTSYKCSKSLENGNCLSNMALIAFE